MDINLLRQISIKDYLAALNCRPARDRGHYGMYHSPFRAEGNASFKVDYNKNLWYDFGTGEGGSILDLVMRMEQCTLPEAIRKLEGRSSEGCLSSIKSRTCPVQPSAIEIVKVQPLVNPALIGYLRERKINIGTAKRHCPEVYYAFGRKEYFAVGFRNDSGGYELRNKYFKGCTSKDMTSVVRDNRSCLVFEGFMDYLSYLTFQKSKYPQENVIVLNSVSNLGKAAGLMASFDEVSAFLDNDNAGKNTLEKMNGICNVLHDHSGLYLPYKDFNEFLCAGK
ncbi:DNA primase [Bacteroidia bacterium]|nr:DNA primase [Bacteroidia bacterium]